MLPPMERTPRPGDAYVQSFARGLGVIRAFSARRPAMTLSEVADAAGLSRAGARRILLTLVRLGYVAAEGRQFQLTPRILDLGFAYLSSTPLWSLAEPIMENLVEQVHESSSASVLDDTDIIYVLRIPTHKIMAISLGVGSRLPAYCTSMGRVLLAGLEDGAVEAILKRSDLKAHTSRTVTRRAQLLERVQEVRARGWSLVNQELEEGLVSISAPIRDRTGRTVAALNVSGQANRTPAAQVLKLFLPPLRAAANQISALLPRR
ncbi:MAG TPA: IclR family transcriptional regulator C-terminal domain-containing protein [Myxococcaceae bacterium]|nr:IclR family transcriptional regulator C-terminal domain-containing protein [Myxococcaceae bacterium]